MGAEPEAEMVVRGSPDVEAVRLVEDRLVAVGGAVEEDDLVAGPDELAVELDVPGGGAGHVVDGAGPADDFLDGGIERPVRIVPEYRPLVGVLGEGQEALGDRAAGRLGVLRPEPRTLVLLRRPQAARPAVASTSLLARNTIDSGSIP